MADKQFTDVCAACGTPSLIGKKKWTAWDFLILAGATMGGVVAVTLILHDHDNNPPFFYLLGAALGLGIAFNWLCYLDRKYARTCPSCHSERLVPVTSPEGLRILKEQGFIES